MASRQPSRSTCALLAPGLAIALAACGGAPHDAVVASAPEPITDSGLSAPFDPFDAGEDASIDFDGDAGDDAGEGVLEGAREPSAVETGPCPESMVLVESETARFCIDKYEASLVELVGDGTEKPYPHWLPVDGHIVRAVSVSGVFPQGYISEVQAADACAASSKRLCSHPEWKTACMGPRRTTFPYGSARRPGTCHDSGRSAVGAVFGLRALMTAGVVAHPAKPTAKNAQARQVGPSTRGRAAETKRPRPSAKPPSGRSAKPTPLSKKKRVPAKSSARPASVEPNVWSQLNDPRLGQVDGALARTGSHEGCVSGYGAVDMVGNIHEWVKSTPSSSHGTFAGGYYLDTSLNGDGCEYRTTAHAHDYHDYSTGFRCCADPAR